MSKNFKVNSEYLYSEGDIDSYVNNVIKHDLGGFKAEHRFLINKKFGTANNPYYVLYSGAIDSAGKIPLDFFFDKTKQPTPVDRDDRKDVFDELMPIMLSEENCKAKILFPYNITNIHWLTGEIVINKQGDNVSIEIYTHDPHGGGQLSWGNCKILSNSLKNSIEANGLQVTSVTAPKSPFTNARQSTTDDTSCGVITADEVVKRITDHSLNISSPYPLGAEQLRLSQLTFLQEKLGEEDTVYQYFKKQVTLKETDSDLDDSPIIHPVQNVPVLTVGEIREKVEQIVSFKDISDTDKIDQLKQIEKEHYKPFIQQLAYKKTQEELKDLVEVLADLGYLTTKLGELSGELKYYTDAAVFYQYVITITTESKNTFTKQELTNPYQQLTDIQELIFSTIGGDQEKMPVVSEEATSNKKMLSKLRLRADLNMEMIEKNYRQQVNADKQEEKQKYQALYIKTTKELFEDTANVMQKFLAKLYSDSEKELTIPPPCKYAVIGLGSMALKQMTPYSDLEFAILIENDGQDESQGIKIKQYFKNLSHLVNFKMINLGESIIPTSKYKLDMSHLVHRGVNFDLGGKTPLGRIEGDKQYELIKTIDWMLYYVRNEGDKASKIDKNLPYILEKVCYVYGDEELVKEYQGKVTEFLHSDQQGRLNYETRALKLLTEKVVETSYTEQTSSLEPKKGDLDKLQPNLLGAECRLFDVKQEIYRLPDRILYNLSMCYGIEGDSAWDIIDKLWDKKVIISEAATNLKNAVTFATTLRLKTYLHHKAQTEDMSIFVRPAETESKLKAQITQIFHLSEEDLGEQGGLFQYFYTALPLHERLKDFCNQYQTLDSTSKQTFFQGNKFYIDDHANKGFIHYRLAQYKEAQTNLEEALSNPENQHNLQLRNTLGNIYNNFGNGDEAIKQFQYCLEIYKLIYKDEPHPSVATSLDNLGIVYDSKGQYDKAIEYYTESLEMMKLIYKDQPHPSVAGSLNNLGLVYARKGQYDKAIEYSTQSLEIYKPIYKDQPHPSVANSLNNLGLVYASKGQDDKAIEYYSQSLEIYKPIYKDQPHPSVANSLNNLGLVYASKGQYDKAIEYYTESLEMRKLIYKDEPHPDVAGSLNNLGEVYRQKGQYDKAIEYCTQSLEMMKLIYKDEPHPDVATSLNNLGIVYDRKGQYDKAIEYYTQSLEMKKLIYKEQPHPFVATSLNNLGNVYNSKGQYDKAIEYSTQSLEMRKLIYKDKPHPDVAASLNNLGVTYKDKGQDDKAIEYCTQSLEMMKLIYKDKPHPDVAASLNNLGNVYYRKGQYDKAIEYSTQSLEIYKPIYKDQPHPFVATSLNNLGNVYNSKGQYDKAIEYYTQSLEMRKLIYKDKPHPDVASSLNNLGIVYYRKGQDDKAIEYYTQSLEMRKLIYKDKPHPDVAASLHNLGDVYYRKGQDDKAIEYYTQSLEMRKLIYKDEPHPDVAASLHNLGDVYYRKGQYDKAIEYSTQSLEMRKLIYKDEPHPDVATSLNNLGEMYRQKGQHDKAIEYSTESLEMRKLIYKDQPHPDVAASLNNLGLVYNRKGQYDKAIEYLTQSLEMKKLIYKDEPHPDVATSLNNLGTVYHAKGQYDKAIEYGSQALQMISTFQDHPYQETIQNYLIEFTKLFAKIYCLNPPKIENKTLDFCKQGLDFTDYELHYNSNASEQQVEEMIEEYKLALIFLPKEELAIKLEIYNKLTELTGVNQKSIELWLAVAEGDTDKIKELITAEVDLDNVPFITTTPLIQAIITGNIDMVSVLLSGKIDINKPNNDQDQASPLYCSLGWFGQPINMKIVELLLANGADVNKPMYDGDTPMHMAHYRGNKEAIKLLLQYGAEINAKNDEDKTPLHCLLKKDFSVETKLDIIKEFHGMYDVTAQDKDGKTVIDYAKEHCPESLSLFSDNVEVVDPVDLSVTDFTITPDISSTNTSDNIDIDVTLSGRLVD